MPTRVIDFELSGRTGSLDHLGSRYTHACLLLRWKGAPVGRVTLPVNDGFIDSRDLEDGLAQALGRDFWFAWLREAFEWDPCPPVGEASALTPAACTVAICTRERPDDLDRTLSAIGQLSRPPGETLVVDNRPATTATADVVRTHAFARYVRQDEGGLDAARNRALAEARHEVVAFTDDDATPDPGWLAALIPNFADPIVMCVTGLTMPLELETSAQETFERYSPFSRGFARRTFDSRSYNPLAAGRAGAGANMALRRSAMTRVGLFDEALDAGTVTRSGGDHEYFSRILSAGYRIVYEPSALSWHRHRRSHEELRDTLSGYGTGVYAMLTRALLEGGETSAFKIALSWLIHGQLPQFFDSVFRRPGHVPLDLLLAEYRGCLRGPLAYLRSRRDLARRRAGRTDAGRRLVVPTP